LNLLKILFLFFLFIYILSCIYLYLIQDRKVFNKKWAKPIESKIAKKIYFTTSDGIKLEGAFTKNGDNLPLVLYFSGNANNVIEFLDKIAPKIKNFNFIGFNYPGYAGSEGKPCEECIEKYALEIYDKYKPDIIIGRSLGTAVASYVASKRKVKGIILITPFDSIENIAKKKYPIFPISLLLKYKFKEAEYISKTKATVVIIALKHDDIIPEKSLNNLIKHIKNLKKIIYIDGVKHGYIYEYPKIIEILKNALNYFTLNKSL
jgi:pimeloyl-ACP methyl ester carboxylesterase